jgi:carbamoyltransferase
VVANICINGYHDGSISIVDENGVVAHLLEERYVHVKHQGPPMVCLSKIEDYIDTFDDISFTHLFHQFADFHWAISYLHYISKVTTPDKLMTPMIHSGHHDLHAICGFSHSGFDDAIVVVIDGAGSTFKYGKENQTIYEIYDSSMQIMEKNIVGDGTTIDESDCPLYVNKKTNIGAGYVYSGITEACGFNALDCGKTMGLSAYGEEDSSIPELLSFSDGGNKNFVLGGKPNLEFQGYVFAVLKNYPIKEFVMDNDNMDCLIPPFNKLTDEQKTVLTNYAYRVQKDYEDYLIATCQRAVKNCRSKNLILTGGCALNCVANYKLLKSLPEDITLYVEPVSDDSGVSLGGAYQSYGPNKILNKSFKLDNLYLGGQLSYSYKLEDDESEYDVEPEHVAKLISLGNIVAIAQGRSEIGPRALGNRSILFDPRVKDGRDIVNTVKKREYFRPFAGTVLKEHAKEWFDLDRLDESPFMMYAVDALSDKKDKIPAILHIDGTCRIQTVTSKQNKNYYDLISEFHKLTGVPILFNTSFNLAGDTMVETIEDAFRTIRNSDINYMYLPEIKKLISVPYNLGKSTKPCYNL